MRNIDSCRFCKIISNVVNERKCEKEIPICDTVLFKTENFLVLPVLGALAPGYIMIISRKHICSMAYSSQNEIKELSDLITKLSAILFNEFHIAPVVFEHGSAVGQFNLAANSVDHAHIHLVPVVLNNETALLQSINAVQITEFQKLRAYCGEPYLLYINEKNQRYISVDKTLQSQFMRRWIAKEMGYPLKYDWRSFEFAENITETVSKLNPTKELQPLLK